MYFDNPLFKKKERMSMFKFTLSLMAALLISIAALPAFAADDLGTRNADFMNKFSIALSDKPANSNWLQMIKDYTDRGIDLSKPKNQAETAEIRQFFNRLDNSAAALASTGGLGTVALVNKLVQNLFGRSSNVSETSYFAGRLDSGQMTKADIVLVLVSNASPTDAAALSAKAAALTTAAAPTTSANLNVDKSPTATTGVIVSGTGAAAAAPGASNTSRAGPVSGLNIGAAPAVAANNNGGGNSTISPATSTPAVSAAPAVTTSTDNTAPSKAALGDALDLLKELTVDLKIEEEDKSDSYQVAQKRIDGQRGTLSTQLGKDISSPSVLDKSVKELQERLANATTDEELKQIAAAILPLQTQTEIWVSNTGILGQVGKDTTQVTVQVDDTIKAINDRVIAGIQNVIRSKPVTCTTAYDPIAHAVVTRCN